MGGFAPLPTRLKELRGIRPDRINHNEPQFDPGAPTPPAYLDHYGRTLWAEIVALLGPAGLLTKADRLYPELLCQTYSELRHALRKVNKKKSDPSLVTPATNLVPGQNIHHRLACQARAMLLTLLREGGLTPASRSKLHAQTEEDKQAEDFLNEG